MTSETFTKELSKILDNNNIKATITPDPDHHQKFVFLAIDDIEDIMQITYNFVTKKTTLSACVLIGYVTANECNKYAKILNIVSTVFDRFDQIETLIKNNVL